jgi:hypothetical protein
MSTEMSLSNGVQLRVACQDSDEVAVSKYLDHWSLYRQAL